MAEQENIEFNVTAKGINQTAYDFSRLGDAAATSGQRVAESSGRGELGAKGLGIAVKNLGHDFGVTGAMSRLLGHEVADLAIGFGSVTSIVGVVALAAMGAYKVYEHFAEATKKKREELDKSVSSLESEVSALYRNAGENEKVTRANYDLLEAKRQLLLLELDDKIEKETEALSKQYDVVEKMATASSARVTEMGELEIEDDPELIREKKKAERKLEIQEKTLINQETLREKYDKAVSYGNYSGADERARKEFEALQKERAKDIIGLKAYQDRVAAIQARDAEESAKRVENWEANLTALKNKSFYADEKQREEQEKNDRKMYEMRLSAAQDMAQGVAQTFETLYQIGGKQAHKYFELYKAAAISETIISTYKAAQAAYAFGTEIGGPGAGAAMATIAIAAGMAKVAAIEAQNFGRSAGGTAAGGYSTVGEQNNPYRYFNYEQSQNGTGWRPGQGQTNINIYAMDSKSFKQYLEENPEGVLTVVDKQKKGMY